jgi:hypothetical protein
MMIKIMGRESEATRTSEIHQVQTASPSTSSTSYIQFFASSIPHVSIRSTNTNDDTGIRQSAWTNRVTIPIPVPINSTQPISTNLPQHLSILFSHLNPLHAPPLL